MKIARKIGGAGVALVASAATLMLGLGPAGAASVVEVDGVQLLNGGTTARVVIDVNCPNGHAISTFVRVQQRIPAMGTTPPGIAVATGGATITCVHDDNDFVVDAGGSGLRTGPAICVINLNDPSLRRFNSNQWVEPGSSPAPSGLTPRRPSPVSQSLAARRICISVTRRHSPLPVQNEPA